MKMRFGYEMLVAMTFSMVGVVAAGAQSGTVGGQANPTAVSSAGRETAMPVEDNGARPGDSHVRIVRLSEVKGVIALDRKTGNGFEATMPNMPIVQGAKLRTSEGYAEVEFEDNSTLRVTPNSLVEFPLLALRSSGAKASTVKVVRGMVYVNLQGTKDNEFVLEADGKKMTVAPSTHVRLKVEGGKTVVSVFNGSVAVQHGTELTVVAKKQSLTLGGDEVAVAKKLEQDPYDAWDKESNEYHARYSQANAFAGGGASYGLSDLNYYGGFINGGSYGSFWQPYLTSAGWNPYGSGVWAFYPGAGYSFVSPYPWGWLPYHTGSWSFYPGYGWGWQPGGSFNGLNNLVGGGGQATGTLRTPTRPVAPAVGASLVVAGDRPIVISQQDKAGNFVFQRDSAGLGVPRGTLGSLNKISNHVEQHGSASMPVYAAAPSTGAFSHAASAGPVTLRAGSAAPSANSSFGSGSPSGSFGGPSGAAASPHSVAAPGASGGSGGSSGGGSRGGSSPK
jgi:FecR protein